MRVNVIDFTKEKTAQIYMSKQEEQSETVQDKIKNLKSEYKNIGIFVSGDDDIKSKLEKLVMFQKDLQKH